MRTKQVVRFRFFLCAPAIWRCRNGHAIKWKMLFLCPLTHPVRRFSSILPASWSQSSSRVTKRFSRSVYSFVSLCTIYVRLILRCLCERARERVRAHSCMWMPFSSNRKIVFTQTIRESIVSRNTINIMSARSSSSPPPRRLYIVCTVFSIKCIKLFTVYFGFRALFSPLHSFFFFGDFVHVCVCVCLFRKRQIWPPEVIKSDSTDSQMP